MGSEVFEERAVSLISRVTGAGGVLSRMVRPCFAAMMAALCVISGSTSFERQPRIGGWEGECE